MVVIGWVVEDAGKRVEPAGTEVDVTALVAVIGVVGVVVVPVGNGRVSVVDGRGRVSVLDGRVGIVICSGRVGWLIVDVLRSTIAAAGAGNNP